MTDQEINEAVARELGWELRETSNLWYRKRWFPPDGDSTTPLPNYCTDIAAAWEVIEVLKKEKWTVVLNFFMGHDYGCAIYGIEDKERPRSECLADTASEAICRAFLKLREQEHAALSA